MPLSAIARACRRFAGGLARVGVAGVLLAAAAVAEAQAPVKRIDVTGAALTDAAAVQSQLAFRTGERLTPDLIDRSIKRLFATGLYADVRITEGTGGLVTVAVVENPRIARIDFQGNRDLDAARLGAAIALKRGAPYTRARANADAIAIRDLYRREGRYQAKVEALAVPQRSGVALTFRIEEGEINKVRRIAFTGNRAYGDVVLRDVITTTQSGWLDIIKSNLTFDRERLEADRMLLRLHYQKHGYADASVAEPQAVLDPASGRWTITFAIDEGERYTQGPERIDAGATGIDTARLMRRIEAREGRLYDGSRIDATAAAIDLELAGSAHPFVRAVPHFERDAKARRIGVVYRLQGTPRLHIGRIEISGNARTLDRVIRRELRMAEGDPFSPVLIEGARKRLLRTGLFKSVELKPVRTKEAERVDLHVAVAEQDTRDLSVGIGYSQNDGVIGDIGYSDANLFGTGITGKVKLEAGERRWGGEVGLYDPRILDSDVGAGFDLFYRDTDHTLASSYKDRRWGGAVKAGLPITDEITTGVSYTFVRSTLHDVGPNASAAIKEAAPGFPSATTSTYDTSSVGTFVAYDTRDNRRMPSSGVYAIVRQDVAGLGGDANYLRATADLRGYYPLPAGIVLAGRAGGGVIGGYGGQDVRLLDMFYRGSDIVRGFAASGLGPRDSRSANQDALGGKSYYVASAELRYPIPLVPESFGIKGTVFADAGSLFGANRTAGALPGLTGNSAAPRISAGPGIVWNSPLGPLQASYGFVLSKQPGDKTQPFNFGLGSGF